MRIPKRHLFLSYLFGISFKILESVKSKSMLSASFSLLWIQYSIEAINYNHLNNGPLSNLHPKQLLFVLFNSKCRSNLNNSASRHLVLASHKRCYFHDNLATWSAARRTATTSWLGSGAHTDYQIITGSLSSEDEVAKGWCWSFVATYCRSLNYMDIYLHGYYNLHSVLPRPRGNLFFLYTKHIKWTHDVTTMLIYFISQTTYRIYMNTAYTDHLPTPILTLHDIL